MYTYIESIEIPYVCLVCETQVELVPDAVLIIVTRAFEAGMRIVPEGTCSQPPLLRYVSSTKLD